MIALASVKDDNGNTKIDSRINFYSIGISIIGFLSITILYLILADRSFIYSSLELHSKAISAMCADMAASKLDRENIKKNHEHIQAELRDLRRNQFVGPMKNNYNDSGSAE